MKDTIDNIEIEDFDREYGLADLLPLSLVAQLFAEMDSPGPPLIVLTDGTLYYGPDDQHDYSSYLKNQFQGIQPQVDHNGNRRFVTFDLTHELETIGFLVFRAGAALDIADPVLLGWGRLIARMLNRIMQLRYGNLMTAGLHGQVVADSYANLRQKNRQLAASEEKYRLLAESLEVEVEKKTRQIQKNQLYMLQQEKMASIGQLAAGIAHEINNPVGFVISNLGTLRTTSRETATLINHYRTLTTLLTQTASDGSVVQQIKRQMADINRLIEEMDLDFVIEDTESLIDESLDGAKRVKIIVENLRNFTHPSIDTAENLDINDCLDTTLAILSGNVPTDVTIVRHYGDLPKVNGHLREINQVFFNVLKNALQAVGDKGEITITTTTDDATVGISISDTGPGVAEADAGKLFDPFFTTREVGSGTGLGLFHAYTIVRKHGGTISMNSRPNEGACFIVRIPIGPVGEPERSLPESPEPGHVWHPFSWPTRTPKRHQRA